MQARPTVRRVSFADGLRHHGERAALVDGDDTITYTDLADRVDAAAAWLGVERSFVLVEAANRVDAVVWYLAALSGGHPVLLTGEVGDGDALLETYRPDVVVTAGEPQRRHGSPAHELHPDLALLLSTSGSTGSPKLVRLSHENLESNAAAIARYLRLTPIDRAITTLPMHYCYGLSVLHSHLDAGASIVLEDRSVVDRCFWERFRETGTTSLAGVPHTFDLLDRVGFDEMHLPSLRYVTQAGGRLAPEKVRRLAQLGRARGWELYVMYGQTEATARMAYLPPSLAERHPDAVGLAVDGGRFSLAPVPEANGNDTGELVYRGPNVMLGYAETPQDLALGRTVDELRTGDLATIGSDGLVRIVGRRSRFLKLYGLRVDLGRIEALVQQAGIRAVCTGDDEAVRVAVEGRGGVDRVARIVRDDIGLPAHAVDVVGAASLPILPNGKPDLIAVEELFRDRSAAPAVEGTPDDVDATFREVLAVERVTGSDTFVSLGGDSLAYVEMSVALEEHLGHLPRDWHLTPVASLARARAPRKRRPRLETTVVVRALAIVAIVANHADWFHVIGGAHVLLAVAGFNFARFQVPVRRRWPAVARVAAPTMAWVGMVAAATDDYGLSHALLVHSFVGAPGTRFSYWFVETLLVLLVCLGALLSVPWVRTLQTRHPFRLATGLALVGLVLRFDLVQLPEQRYAVFRPQEVLWLFAAGWAAACADTTQRRLVVTALVALGIHDFFGDPAREAVVLTGTLLVLWFRTLPTTGWLRRPITTLAGASLYIYLVHWQVLSLLDGRWPPMGVVVSLAAGAVFWRVAREPVGRIGATRSTVDTPDSLT